MFISLHHRSTTTNFASSTRKKSPMLSSAIHYHRQVHTSAGHPVTNKKKNPTHLHPSLPPNNPSKIQQILNPKMFMGVLVATPFEASPLSTNTSLPASLICYCPLNGPEPRHANWDSLTKELYRSVKIIGFSI